MISAEAKWWAKVDTAPWHRVGVDGRRALCGARIGEGFNRSDSEMADNAHTSEICPRCESANLKAGEDQASPRTELDGIRHELRKVMSRAAYAVESASIGDPVARMLAGRELDRASEMFSAWLSESYAIVGNARVEVAA